MFLFVGAENTPSRAVKDEYEFEPVVVQEPLLREKIVPAGEHVSKIVLKAFLNEGRKYDVWVENAECCRCLGKIEKGDCILIFVSEEEVVRLPAREKILLRRVEKDKKPSGPITHSTTPIYKRDLPDGRVEFGIITPEGEKVIEIIGEATKLEEKK